MPRWTSILSFLGGALLAGLVVVLVSSGRPSSGPQQGFEETEDPAPNFQLQTIDGDVFRLKEHRGKVVVLNFWGTWCPPCREEIPDLVSLQKELGDDGLQVVGVALERNAGVKKVRAFAEKQNINYPVGLGDGSITQKYGGIRRVPTTVVIDADGKIRGRLTGQVTEKMLRPGLKRLLDNIS